MKKIRLEAKLGLDCSKGSLFKELLDLIGRVKIRFNENGFEVFDIDDDKLNDAIDLIDDYYIINNLVIEDVVETSDSDELKSVSFKDVEDKTKAITNKAVFENKIIEETLNKLIKTILWAINSRYASIDDVRNFIISANTLISKKYSDYTDIDYSIGDIVTVNYCNNLSGEISGGYVHAIVCDIADNDCIYVIPIAKGIKGSRFDEKDIAFLSSEDVIYYSDTYEPGIALLRYASYINRARVYSTLRAPIVGRVKPEFFNRLLDMIPKALPFDNRMQVQVDATDGSLNESTDADEEIKDVDPENVIDVEKQEIKKAASKMTYEEALNNIIGNALNDVDRCGIVADEVRKFVVRIGMDASDGYLIQAFIKACETKKIKMDRIAGDICLIAGIKQSYVENSLKKTFNQWLEQYPDIKAKFPKMSLTVILKAFANKMNEVK